MLLWTRYDQDLLHTKTHTQNKLTKLGKENESILEEPFLRQNLLGVLQRYKELVDYRPAEFFEEQEQNEPEECEEEDNVTGETAEVEVETASILSFGKLAGKF